MDKMPSGPINKLSSDGGALEEERKRLEAQLERLDRLDEILDQDQADRDTLRAKKAAEQVAEAHGQEERPAGTEIDHVESHESHKTTVDEVHPKSPVQQKSTAVHDSPAPITPTHTREAPQHSAPFFTEQLSDMFTGVSTVAGGVATIVAIPTAVFAGIGAGLTVGAVGGALWGTWIVSSFLSEFVMEASAGLGKKIKGAAKKLAGFIGLGGGKDDGHGKKKGGGDHGHH